MRGATILMSSAVAGVEVEKRISPLRNSQGARGPSVEMKAFGWREEEDNDKNKGKMRGFFGALRMTPH